MLTTDNGWPDYALRKWIMVAYKGGACVQCQEAVTEANLKQYHFHHKIAVHDGHDKADRWSGGARFLVPFSRKWKLWADRVELICEKCHRDEHRKAPRQLSMDEFLEVQNRLDVHADANARDAAQSVELELPLKTCAACGKFEQDVRRMFVGPAGCICDACIGQHHSLVGIEKKTING